MSPRATVIGNRARGVIKDVRDLAQLEPESAVAIVMALQAELIAMLQGQQSLTERTGIEG